jgi:2-dehydropantoate 2-reductase
VRIAIAGAGALGSAYGTLLARGGAEVTLIDVWREHVEAIDLHATTDYAAAADADAVIVLTKSFATADVAAALAPRLRRDAIAVTLQNGLGNDATLAAALGAERVVAGATTLGAELLGPGRVRIGPVDASLTTLASGPRVEELAAALCDAGLPVEVRADARAVIWRKLAMTASIGPLCALLRTDVATVLRHDAARRALGRAFDEIVAVAATQGVAVDADLWDHALATWSALGPHRPSIAVDVEAGRRTEIDALCGAVARLGHAPVNRLLASSIRAGEPR